LSSNEIEISVLKYDTVFTKRTKDIKKNTWFSFPNDFLLHPDFVDISGEEIKWFLWIVSVCSKVNQNKIRLNILQAEKFLSLDRKHLFSALEKLQGKQTDVALSEMATGSRRDTTDGDGIRRDVASTLHYTTLQNTTLQNTTLQNITEHNTLSVEPKKSVATVMENKISFVISKNKQVLINSDLVNSWADTYPKEYLELSFKEMRNWILSNEHKAPKSAWSKFMNGWFSRGYEEYRKTLKSNPPKITVDDLSDILGGSF
jgi:hypothetical protein